MKKSNKVISGNNLPSRLPIWSTLSCALALDRWNAPEWLWGAVGFLFLIGWVAMIYGMIVQEKVDIFEKDNK
jgi:hypothetical protein